MQVNQNQEMSNLSCHSNQAEQSSACKDAAVESDPMQILNDAKAAVNAGQVSKAIQIIIKAEPSLQEIVDKNPARTDIMYAVGAVFHIAGQTAKAEQWYKKILEQKSDALVYNRLAQICEHTSRLCQAVQYHRKAVETDAKAGFRSSLATSLIRTGSVQKGIEIFRKLIEEVPDRSDIHSNFLANLPYLPKIDQQLSFAEHRRWAEIHTPVNSAEISYDNTAEPDRRLRIGYMSGDFRSHSVTYFFESLLDGHDRQQVQVYGYGSVGSTDQVTERLKSKFNHYRDILGVDDEQAADLIKQDRIDILVDLVGHTKGRRLFVLAQRPAPVQVTYLGYSDTTGMQQVDYLLTDALANLPQSQRFYTEELFYLPNGFLCYSPCESAPPVGPLPAEEKGYVTFGSFNNNCKINPYIIELWVQILKVNENFRLLLKFYGGSEEQLKNYYLRQFERYGVSSEKIKIFGWQPQFEHFKFYEQVDIALDTYPYNGTTTTCEALWMGVPVISLVGKHHLSRVGLSILSRVGMEFFAAGTPQDYVAKAAALAARLDALVQLRSTMRARISNSTLCDAKGYAGTVESAYRKMWHRWCQSRNGNR